MIAEISVFGVFFSGAFVMACLAGGATLLVRRLLHAIGFYRLVWHRHMVDLALFVILWAVASMIVPALAQSLEKVG